MPWCGFCDRFFSDYEFGTEDYCEGCFSWLEEESLRKGEQIYCKSSNCYQRVKNGEQYCSDCRQTYCSHSSCLNKIPKTSDYCSSHSEFCWLSSCSNRKSKNEEYCSLHLEQDKLQLLVKQRTSLSNPQEVVRFNTWWNKNLATVINGNSSYTLWLLVYEPAERSRTEILQKFEISNGYDRYNLEGVKNKASSLRSELNGDNPILAIHPSANSYVSFNSLITSPYVWKEEIGKSFTFYIPFIITVGISQIPSNIDDYFKSLDIIRVKKVNSIVSKTYFHVGIYLGKNTICHICDPNGLISEENLQVRITGWDAFLNGWLGTPIGGKAGELVRCRSVIPFKPYKKSIEQAVKAYWADYGSGKYDLYNDNCEHFANAIVYGVYYSEQAGDTNLLESSATKIWDEVWTKNFNFVCKIFQPNHWGTLWRDAPILRSFNSKRYRVNNRLPGESKNICLKNEINSWDSNGRFGNLTSNELRDRRDEYESQYLMEIPAKQDCRIM